MLVKRTSLLMFLLGKIKKKLIISEWTQVPCCLSTRAQVLDIGSHFWYLTKMQGQNKAAYVYK